MKKGSLFILANLFILSGCGQTKPTTFTVTWNVDGDFFSESYYKGEMPVYKFGLEKKSDETYNYSFKEWDKPIVEVSKNETYTAIFDKSYVDYDITWIIDDVMFHETYHYGDTPSLCEEGVFESEKFKYSELTWEPEVESVKKDQVYYAKSYTKELKSYKITFVVDGTNYEVECLYGEEPVCPVVPIKESTLEHSYAFSGWDKEIEKVTKEASYVAKFEENPHLYNITFDLGFKTINKLIEYGKVATFEETVDRPSSKKYDYEFVGWDKPLDKVVGDTIYTAVYKETIKNYTVNFYDEDGVTLLGTKTFPYDTLIDKNSFVVEEKEGKRFAGWISKNHTKSPLFVNGDMNLTANYITQVNLVVHHETIEGSVVKYDTVLTLDYGESYELNFSPTRGYYPNQDFIKGIGEEDKEITIYYSELDVWDGVSVSSSFTLGAGTTRDPFRITSGADLALFRNLVNSGSGKMFIGKAFRLTKSIDISAVSNFVIGETGILSPSVYFAGSFDGNNCAIRGINITGEKQCSALFSKTGSGEISNLTVYGEIDGGNFSSGIVSRAYNNFVNCNNYATVYHSGANAAGGIAAENQGAYSKNCTNYGFIKNKTDNQKTGGVFGSLLGGSSVENCYNYGLVEGRSYVGGIVGHYYASSETKYEIKNCANYADILSRYTLAGGIVGGQDSKAVLSLSNLTNYGNIKAESHYAGGIVGQCHSYKFTNCVNYGNVFGLRKSDGYVGGICGQLQNYKNDGIDNCINYGEVKGFSRVGGLVGNLHQNITECINYGYVTNVENAMATWTGGICGTIGDSVILLNCVNNGFVNALGNNAGGIAGTTANTEGLVIQIIGCINNGDVSSCGYSAGGILGTMNADYTGLTIKGCVNFGTISSGNRVGGIVGYLLANSSSVIISGPDACENYGNLVCIGIAFGNIIGWAKNG